MLRPVTKYERMLKAWQFGQAVWGPEWSAAYNEHIAIMVQWKVQNPAPLKPYCDYLDSQKEVWQ